ncbi:retropepsin-like domain-containing protein [Luteimonas sp. 50]|uniref:Retropepsin-like domain-containing protein n=1 Tax=Cognatiluteimonas sedimenti TaxID=2927791 RepID=A0ABT0A4D8_9GAMM|nr:aspartyl protease family protein [Lysobacter sedimenti]MCJ0825857.1 retropepsin-like domain-containing protein [Lysobacter sedimenti]
MRLLLSLVLLPGLAGAAAIDPPAPAPVSAAPAAVLQLEPYRRTVAVRVMANGTPGLFALDTAAGHTIASPEFAAAAGCKPWGELGGFTMTGKHLGMPRCDGLAFTVGGHRLRAPVAGVMQVAELFAKDAPPIEGLLALDAFGGQTITIDFAGGKLYVETPASAAQRIAGASEVPISLSREVQGVALAVNVEVPTPQGIARFELDSGNGGTVLVSKPYARLFGLDPEAEGPQQATIEVAPGIVVHALAFTPGMNIDGNLGMPFLKDWIVTLDLKEGRMWLRRNPVPAPPGMGVPPPPKA